MWRRVSDKRPPHMAFGACSTRRGVPPPPWAAPGRARAQTVGGQRLANARDEPGKTGANRTAEGARGGAAAGRIAKEPGGPAPSVEISRKPRSLEVVTAHARQPGPGILLRHQPPPGLTTPRAHARSFSVLAPLFLHFPPLPG